MPRSEDNGVYYFLGNITSHILHALPLHKELGGTFVVLSQKTKREVERYGVPVIAIDNKPYAWRRFGWRLKPISHYLEIGSDLKKTTDFLNDHAKVVLFYELYDFAEPVRLTKPQTVFLTHGNMLKDYMASNDRIRTFEQYDYMAALGPRLKHQFIERDGIPTGKLIDLGIARTDQIYDLRNQKPNTDLLHQLGLDPARPVIAYLPTFWGASSVYHTGLEIVRNFPANYSLIVRPHPQTPRELLWKYRRLCRDRPNVVLAPEGKFYQLGLLDVFAISSAIIGDISSVMLEAILLDKPLLFAYDKSEYAQGQQDYQAIADVAQYSQAITPGTTPQLPTIIQTALQRGIDPIVWSQTKDAMFFHHDGTSIKTITTFVKSLLDKESS